MRHPFIRRAKKTAFLQDLIDRYKRWKLETGNINDLDSDDSNEYETSFFYKIILSVSDIKLANFLLSK